MKIRDILESECNAARARGERISSIVLTRRAESRLKNELPDLPGNFSTMIFYNGLPVTVIATKEMADELISFAIDVGGHFIYVRE